MTTFTIRKWKKQINVLAKGEKRRRNKRTRWIIYKSERKRGNPLVRKTHGIERVCHVRSFGRISPLYLSIYAIYLSWFCFYILFPECLYQHGRVSSLHTTSTCFSMCVLLCSLSLSLFLFRSDSSNRKSQLICIYIYIEGLVKPFSI